MNSGGSVLVSTTSMDQVNEWRKRSRESEEVVTKRPRYDSYYRSESERDSREEDTESVYSIQDKETDIARDTTDTDTISDSEDTDIEVKYEYEVATDSEDVDFPLTDSSSGTDDMCFAEGAIAAVLCDSSVDRWTTDAETSDGSSIAENVTNLTFRKDVDLRYDGRKDFWTCVQCKSQKNNPLFRYCEKCFQVRKSLFPPRPRGKRKRNVEKKETSTVPKVNLETVLKSCIRRLSEDSSGLTVFSQDSNQEISKLDFNNIRVPEHLKSPRKYTSESDFVESPRKKRKSDKEFEYKTFDSGISDKASSVYSSEDNPPTSSKTCDNETSDEILLKTEDDLLDCVVSSSKHSNSEISDKASLTNEDDSTDRVKSSDSGFSEKVSSVSSNSEESKVVDKAVDTGIFVKTSVMSSDDDTRTKYDLCIMCNSNQKNGIFLHGSIGHMCCCYKCAMKSWRTSKRCPICNCKVKNVVKLFTI